MVDETYSNMSQNSGGTGEVFQNQNILSANTTNATLADEPLTGITIGNAASNFGDTMKSILDNTKKVYGDDRNIIFSAISTIMDAVNNSVMGGLTGLKSELEKIINDEKAKGSGKPNAGIDFLADCANFIRFFLEYLYLNKKLKIEKHNSEKIEEARAEVENGDAAKNGIVKAKEKLNKLEGYNKETQGNVEANPAGSNQMDRIDFLNNAFRHLVFTYGQLSGRTIYNIIQFLKNGPPPKVGYFDPISFGSLTSTIIRSTPMGSIAGQIMDSVVDFGKAFINAGEASYVSLKRERELANEYMEYITDKTKTTNSGQKGGATQPVDPLSIDTATFTKYYDSIKAKKDKKDLVDKNYKKRIQKLTGNKGRTNTNHNISQLTTANIEKRIKDVTNAMTELNHVDNLKELLNQILEPLSKKRSIYIKSSSSVTKDNSKIPLLTQEEVSKMRSNPDVERVFNMIINNFDTGTDSPYKDKLDKLTIEKSNPELYGIIMNFIRNNYKSAEDQVNELTKKIGETQDNTEKLKMKNMKLLLSDVVEKEQKLAEAEAVAVAEEAVAEEAVPVAVPVAEQKLAEAVAVPFNISKETEAEVKVKVKSGAEEALVLISVDEAKQHLYAAKQKALNTVESMKMDELINEQLLKLVAQMEQDSVGQDDSGDQSENTKIIKSPVRHFNKAAQTVPSVTSPDKTSKSVHNNITREIDKLSDRVAAENRHIQQLGSRMKDPIKDKGKTFLEEEYKTLFEQLNIVKDTERSDLNKEIHSSGDFGRLASTYVKLKRGMTADIKGLINKVKAVGIKEKELENLETVKSGLKKMLRFISNREFGSINALFKRQRKNKTRRGGGDLSNIRRHIAKATRRIETTLSNFNNTRRNKRIKSKPRRTRRQVNYGH